MISTLYFFMSFGPNADYWTAAGKPMQERSIQEWICIGLRDILLILYCFFLILFLFMGLVADSFDCGLFLHMCFSLDDSL